MLPFPVRDIVTGGLLALLAGAGFAQRSSDHQRAPTDRSQRAVWSVDQRAVTSPVVICHTSPPQLSAAPVCLPL